ncbi:MAG: hypothetical protein C5B47_08055 [Verrucomicrobia bacterium]|nr:MAG: hypothetical protein C5B47_08055 [Verrucomicrobiota bacterium]
MNKPSQSPKATIESAGSILRAARTAKGIPVEQVAHDLRMRPQQVLDLEQNDHARLPHMSYVRLLILYYAKYLDIAAARIEVHLPERTNYENGGYQTVCQQLPYQFDAKKSGELQPFSMPARVVPAIFTCCIILIVIATGVGVYFSHRHAREEQRRLKPPPAVGTTIKTEAEVVKKPPGSLETMRTFDSALLDQTPSHLKKVDPSPLKPENDSLRAKSQIIRNASGTRFLLVLPQATPPTGLKALGKQDAPLRE